jgi:hypothetical protein
MTTFVRIQKVLLFFGSVAAVVIIIAALGMFGS